MKRRRLALGVLVLVGTLGAFVPVRAQDDNQARIDRGRALLRLLADEKYEAFVQASDATMKEVQPADRLKEVWTGIVSSYGAYEKELKASATSHGEYHIVDLVSEFAASPLLVRITLNRQDEVAGLWFKPAPTEAAYEPPAYINTPAFREEPVIVSPGPRPLPGTLTMPKGKGPFPAVVLVHGSGPHDRDETILGNKPFRDIAWGLGSRGVAVLRYEKSTHEHGASFDPKEITIDEETADDAVSAARLLMTRDEIDPRRVLILGHSLGATAAPYIATKEPQIGGLIMLAAAARPIYELAEEQALYIAKVEGQMDEEKRQKLDEIRRGAEALRSGTWKGGDTLLGAPLKYWASLDRMKPLENAKALSIPILIAQGGRDYQVSPDKDFGLWKKELAGRKNVTFKLFEKMDHLFRPGEGPSTPQQYKEEGHVGQRVIEYLADWIGRIE